VWLEGEAQEERKVQREPAQRRGNWQQICQGGLVPLRSRPSGKGLGGVLSGTRTEGGVEQRPFTGSASARHHLWARGPLLHHRKCSTAWQESSFNREWPRSPLKPSPPLFGLRCNNKYELSDRSTED
jgi:hypothetical protein